MKLRFIGLGLAIPLILTATIFAVPAVGGGKPSFDSLIEKGSPFNAVQATSGNVHHIEMTAVEFSNGQLAYRMLEHIVDDGSTETEVTDRYSPDATIPGPVIVITEGDEVFLTINNDITSRLDQQVSVHVHGVHYEIDSDGTLEHINKVGDQGAYPQDSSLEPKSYQYHWIAAPGTAGTWPYHDHNWGGLNGAEHRGLFGAVIVNPASGEVQGTDNNSIEAVQLDDISKDFFLYLGDDAFWGMEIDSTGQETPLWVNPTLKAEPGDYVRFHLIALGTDFHEFKLPGYKWVDPGTGDLINEKDIGPLENHQFTVKTRPGNSPYMDMNESNLLMGMKGSFLGASGDSIPGPSPQ